MSANKLFAVGCMLLIVGMGAFYNIGALSGFAQQEVISPREAAARLYEEGAFIEAAEWWSIVAGQEPGAVDARINAAQSYLQADDLGRAMLWFRRAQTLDPRHPAVQLGLALVRALRVDILGDEPGFLTAVERLSSEVVSRSELAWLTVLFCSAAIGIGTLSYLRRKWAIAAAVTGAVAFMLAVLLVGREISIGIAPPAVVTAFETVLYSEPHAEGAVLSRLYAGAEARIADRRNAWTLITLADGRVGWLPDGDVDPLAE